MQTDSTTGVIMQQLSLAYKQNLQKQPLSSFIWIYHLTFAFATVREWRGLYLRWDEKLLQSLWPADFNQLVYWSQPWSELSRTSVWGATPLQRCLVKTLSCLSRTSVRAIDIQVIFLDGASVYKLVLWISILQPRIEKDMKKRTRVAGNFAIEGDTLAKFVCCWFFWGKWFKIIRQAVKCWTFFRRHLSEWRCPCSFM